MGSIDIPFNITLNAGQFANSDVEFSHQLCFLGESAESFAAWGVGGNLLVLKEFCFLMLSRFC